MRQSLLVNPFVLEEKILYVLRYFKIFLWAILQTWPSTVITLVTIFESIKRYASFTSSLQPEYVYNIPLTI